MMFLEMDGSNIVPLFSELPSRYLRISEIILFALKYIYFLFKKCCDPNPLHIPCLPAWQVIKKSGSGCVFTQFASVVPSNI